MDRNDLLSNRAREKKHPYTILISTWHPAPNSITSFFLKKFYLIPNDSKQKLSNKTYCHKFLTNLPSDYILKKLITNQQRHSNVSLCG